MLTFKLLSMATLLGVATGVTLVTSSVDRDGQAIPQAQWVTWNEGGGAPTTEFMGPWSSATGKYDLLEKVFGAKILEFAYGSVSEAVKAKKEEKEYSYSRYADLSDKFELAGTNTVGAWLSDLGVYLAANERSIDGGRFKECWEDVKIEKVFKFAMQVKKKDGEIEINNLFTSPNCLKAADEAKNLFGGPDGCYKHRETRMGTGGFQNLVHVRAKSPQDYWKTWFAALGEKWGPPKFCKMTGTMRDTLSKPKDSEIVTKRGTPDEKTIFAPDWVSLAIFDRLAVDVALSLRSSPWPWTGTSLWYDELWPVETDSQVDEKIKSMNAWLCQRSDVLMLQETKKDFFETTSQCSSHQYVAPPEGEDAAVVFNSNKYSQDTGATTEYQEKLKEEAAKLAPKPDPGPPAQKEALDPTQKKALKAAQKKLEAAQKKNKFFTEVSKFAVVVIREKKTKSCHTIMSIHSDSDGKYAANCLELAVNTHKAMEKGCQLVVGMDTNVQLKGKIGVSHDEDMLTKFAKDLKLDVFVPEQKTVSKTRSFAQAQILKAAKRDNVKKDFIFRQKATPATSQEGLKARVVNQIDGVYLEEPFPRLEYPVDHFMVFVDDLSG